MGARDKIKLTKEQRDDAVRAIKKFFKEERGEEIGDLASEILLDFVIEKLAPEFYNQGIQDSHVYVTERLEDMLAIQKIRPK